MIDTSRWQGRFFERSKSDFSLIEADTGGTDLINCQNVTSNARDYCCDHTNDCCDTGVGRFRLDSVGTPIKTIRSSASTATRELSSATSSSRRTTSTSAPERSTADISTSRTVTATETSSQASPSSAPDTSSRLSGGAKAGIGVGAALGAVGVLGLIFSMWKRGFARRKGGLEERRQGDKEDGSHTDFRLHELSGEGRNELPGERPQEMSAPTPAWELPGGNR